MLTLTEYPFITLGSGEPTNRSNIARSSGVVLKLGGHSEAPSSTSSGLATEASSSPTKPKLEESEMVDDDELGAGGTATDADDADDPDEVDDDGMTGRDSEDDVGN